MRSLARPLLVGSILLAAATGLSYKLAAAHLARPFDVLHVPSGRTTRSLALGQRTFIADMYWLAAVQYIGDPKADERGWDKLLPLVDLVTDLDPRHGYAYQTAGIVLSAAGHLDESDAILRKGMERGPSYWTFPYYLAFNAWFYRGDLAAGAKYAELAARTPGASANVSHLAVSLASKSGSPEQAIALLQELKATVHDPSTASRLDEQLKLATLERDAQALERAAAQLEARRGRPIAALEELVAAGAIAALPSDPFGGRYLWDPREKKVHSSQNPFRFQLRINRNQPRFQYHPPGTKETTTR